MKDKRKCYIYINTYKDGENMGKKIRCGRCGNEWVYMGDKPDKKIQKGIPQYIYCSKCHKNIRIDNYKNDTP